MVAIKVNNESIWQEFVKTKRVKGFSIEGFFTDKATERPNDSLEEELAAQESVDIIKQLINKI